MYRVKAFCVINFDIKDIDMLMAFGKGSRISMICFMEEKILYNNPNMSEIEQERLRVTVICSQGLSM